MELHSDQGKVHFLGRQRLDPILHTPRTVIIFLLVSFAIEGAQYFELYDATFDPWDLLAYVSILLPLYVLDMRLFNSSCKDKS
jgi:hypothetical protein